MHPARRRRSAPPTGSSAALHRGGRARRSSGRRARPNRRSRGLLITLLVVLGLLVPAAYFMGGGRSDASSGAPQPQRTSTAPAPPRTPSSSAPVTPSTPTAPRTSASPRRTKIRVPAKGSGRFTTAQATGKKVGSGSRLLRYVVEVETGLEVSPGRAAEEIEDILAAPRGWTRSPGTAFQLVGAGAAHDLTIKIATPATADSLCWAGIQQDTGGEYNCEVPGGVVVNLKRWVEGSGTFTGPIHDYRALIINHEMGHFLGHTHQGCAGPGKPAPVMMQQIKGLNGCVPNAWPYDGNGTLITGPPA